jgi:hypothetical protein
MKIITEGLNYMDMVDQVVPHLGIDEFQSSIGEDRELVVFNFIVNAKEVGTDLVEWLERGYEWIIDADISPGEVLDKKWYVFAEAKRRSTTPERIIEVLEDLKTLTGLSLDDWEITAYGNKIKAEVEEITAVVPLSPADYTGRKEGELNEWREIAGLKTVSSHESDPDLIKWQRIAGII